MKYFEWRLFWRFKKSIESTFKCKLNFNQNNSWRGGRQGRGRERRREWSLGRGQSNYNRKSQDEKGQKHSKDVTFVKGAIVSKKIIGSTMS